MLPSFAPSEEASFSVADVRGRVLGQNLSLAQLCARVENGLLPTAALVAAAGETKWRPLHEVLGSGARRIASHWFVSAGGRVVGPVDTETLQRGIEAGRVPKDAMLCAIGEREWQTIDDTGIFADALFDVMETQWIAAPSSQRKVPSVKPPPPRRRR